MCHIIGNSIVDGKSEGVLIGQCILDLVQPKHMVKTASSGSAIVAAVQAFANALAALSTDTRLTAEAIGDLGKTAAKQEEVGSKDTTIRIASTSVKDSHYFMDISLDPIRKADKSLVMVSFLLREVNLCYCYWNSRKYDCHL